MTIWQDIERARQREQDDKDRRQREEAERQRVREESEKKIAEEKRIRAEFEERLAKAEERAKAEAASRYVEKSGAREVLEEVRRDVWQTGKIEKTSDGISLKKKYPVADAVSYDNCYTDCDESGCHSVGEPEYGVVSKTTSLHVAASRGKIVISDSESSNGDTIDFDPEKGPDRRKVREAIVKATVDRVRKDHLPDQLEAEARREIKEKVPFWTRRKALKNFR